MERLRTVLSALVYAERSPLSSKSQLREICAYLPQSTGGSLVVRVLGRPGLGLLREVLAAHALHLGGGGQVDRRFGPLLRTREERPHQPQKEAERTAAATPQIRYHDAGMDTIGTNTGPLQPPGQLVGEEDHGQLR